jgi:hypothetical protein
MRFAAKSPWAIATLAAVAVLASSSVEARAHHPTRGAPHARRAQDPVYDSYRGRSEHFGGTRVLYGPGRPCDNDFQVQGRT